MPQGRRRKKKGLKDKEEKKKEKEKEKGRRRRKVGVVGKKKKEEWGRESGRGEWTSGKHGKGRSKTRKGLESTTQRTREPQCDSRNMMMVDTENSIGGDKALLTPKKHMKCQTLASHIYVLIFS
jgi:hypothetical protein